MSFSRRWEMYQKSKFNQFITRTIDFSLMHIDRKPCVEREIMFSLSLSLHLLNQIREKTVQRIINFKHICLLFKLKLDAIPK